MQHPHLLVSLLYQITCVFIPLEVTINNNSKELYLINNLQRFILKPNFSYKLLVSVEVENDLLCFLLISLDFSLSNY